MMIYWNNDRSTSTIKTNVQSLQLHLAAPHCRNTKAMSRMQIYRLEPATHTRYRSRTKGGNT